MAMGHGRARNRPVGHPAVRLSRRLAAPALLMLLLPVGACSSLGAIAGAAVGASTGTVTVNPLVGYAVAVGVKAGVDELTAYVARVRQNAEQDVIAAAVGEMDVGQTRDWAIVHDIPLFDDEHGQVAVTRVIDTPLTACKEVVFTVNTGSGETLRRTVFTTDACRDTRGWKWAEPEPAVPRWGYLQHIGP
jgi:hypothetical protein